VDSSVVSVSSSLGSGSSLVDWLSYVAPESANCPENGSYEANSVGVRHSCGGE
jgi:hypothetical protein